MAEELSRSAVLKYDDNKVGKITSLDFSVGGNVIPINSFDTADFEEVMLGRKSVTISVSGLLDRTDTNGQVALLEDFLGNNSLASDFEDFTIEPATTETGDISFSGNGIVNDYSEQRGDDGDGVATFSAEITISGAWVKSVVPA